MNLKTQNLISSDAIANYARNMGPSGDSSMAQNLGAIEASQLFESAIIDSDMASCCHAGIWLLHNFLDDSHTICQDINSAEGSYWHAIVHRTEGDFSNAKYWYRRIGQHAIFNEIGSVAGGDFDPSEFVDQCQHDYRSGKLSDEVQAIAYTEWKVLFDFCYQNAI